MKLNFILFLIFLTSCKQNETPGKLDTNEPLTVYNEESYYELLEKNKDLKVKVIDTSCINERKRAESDIKKGKLYFFRSKVWFEWKEMAELLSEYNIEYKDYEHNCFGPPPGFEHDCYEKLMWTEIDKRIMLQTHMRQFYCIIRNRSTVYITFLLSDNRFAHIVYFLIIFAFHLFR